ncbi:hypothetical protein tb265_35440 [Gemmatimonadetes bacterium T265]|nr:hypothetical protein tb265_35440 [Gemmatimonadetes bacterium T265]
MTAAVPVGRLVTTGTLLALWLGAAVLTAAVVAPAAFAVLPTRALAGALVGRVLPSVFVGGVFVGVAGAVLAAGAGGAFARARVVLPAACALLCALAQFGITPRIQTLRAQMGPDIEALPKDDPRRAEFGKLHGVSVLFMGAAGLAAGAALVLTAVAASRDA